MKNKKLIIFANPVLLISGISYVVIMMCLSILMIILIHNGIITAASEKDRIGCEIIFLIAGIGAVAAGFMCMPRWLVYILLTGSTIEYRAAFSKAVIKHYNNYPYVYHAWYKHRGIIPIGYNADYIVISSRMLTKEELQHINWVGISETVIKIRYRRKAYNILQSILPEKQKIQLDRNFIS